jgi:hypothetical protein
MHVVEEQHKRLRSRDFFDEVVELTQHRVLRHGAHSSLGSFVIA